MNELLALAVEAHGGLDRWKALETLQADLSIFGYTFTVKQQPEIFRTITVGASLHEERIELDPASFEGRHTVFDGKRLVMENATGVPLETWDDPPARFAGHSFETPWTEMHAAYFSSEALWTYLTMPFLFTYPGFEVEEIEPWHEDGEEWRTLKVTFPDYVKSHHPEQIARFGPDGLLRRHDYVVDTFFMARYDFSADSAPGTASTNSLAVFLDLTTRLSRARAQHRGSVNLTV